MISKMLRDQGGQQVMFVLLQRLAIEKNSSQRNGLVFEPHGRRRDQILTRDQRVLQRQDSEQ